MRWFHAARTRLRLLAAPRAAESRMDDEIRFHLDMETDMHRRAGLATGEARRRAVVAFGGVERHKEALRDGRGLAWLGGLSLDLRLGARMLVKYPGLTLVGGLAMAFAIWVGTVVFEMGMLFVNPTLPLPGGDRIVQIQHWDAESSGPESRALHDFLVWRQAVRSVTDLGAFEDATQNLTGRDGEARPVKVAAISASGFRVAGTRPMLGRTIGPADEAAGAPPVLVLGHDLWQSRFAGDSAVVGQSVRLGDAYATVVGVMPDGFAFPVAHDAWTPFRPGVADDAPRRGPGIVVFGRLAPGATLESARAELRALGQRAAATYPETHEHLLPRVDAYARLFGGPQSPQELRMMLLIQVFALLLVVLVCANVALLLFARAATREGEIIVRSALGASRRRIVVQLFAEALVLGGLAAAVGLATAAVALREWGLPFLEMNLGEIPFWYDPRLSPATVLYACALTLLGALIAGVVPGLKVTRGIASRLKAGTAGGGGAQFGGVWTAVIVAQVAVTVAFPAVVLLESLELNRIGSYDPGYAAEEYLTVRLVPEASTSADAVADSVAAAAREARFVAVVEALRQRVAADPAVRGVSFANALPRENYYDFDVELDDSTAVGGRLPLLETAVAAVDASYFDLLGAPILAGRGFQPADFAPDARVAIVDQGFVDHVLLGRNPVGQRVRIPRVTSDEGAWFQIVGVVRNLGMGGAAESGPETGLYLPAVPGRVDDTFMLIHARGDPMSLVPRVRALAGAVDPTLRLAELRRMDQIASPLLWMLGMWLRTSLVMTAVALLLSLAGIYAVLSFIVAQRTREIGVRVALGASPRRVITSIFRRPLTQVSLGVAAGAVLIGLGITALFATEQFTKAGGELSAVHVGLILLYAAFMFGVCLLACIVPTRRALQVEPIVAMRVD